MFFYALHPKLALVTFVPLLAKESRKKLILHRKHTWDRDYCNQLRLLSDFWLPNQCFNSLFTVEWSTLTRQRNRQ